MEAQQVQVYGHGHGHEIKTKKRPWPRFLVSCVALMLFLVVSWHFNTVFFFPCAWYLLGPSYHFAVSFLPRHPAFHPHVHLSPRCPIFGSPAQKSPVCVPQDWDWVELGS